MPTAQPAIEPSARTRESRDLIGLSLELKAIRESDREADFVASTDAIDRYGEVVDQSTWRLERFLANPVALYAHDSRSRLPIGQCKNVRVEGNKLLVTIKFSKVTQLAEEVWQQVVERTLRAVSVGFLAHSYEWKKVDDVEVLVLKDCELLEVSVCPIGANQEALARARAKALEAKSQPPAEKERGGAQQKGHDMNLEQENAALKATLAERTAQKETAEKAIETEKAATKAALDRAEKAEKDLAEEKARADKLAEKGLESEVDALVGEKISPDQKSAFLALAKSDKSQFDAIVKTLPPLGLKGKAIVPEPPNETTKAAADPDAELAALAAKD
jgi:HK97 family phage prohead protease